MFPDVCGALGVTGWLLMLLLWAGLVTLAVWGIARLFPDRPARPVRQDAAPPSPVGSGRR